jgi:hypothetical protein
MLELRLGVLDCAALEQQEIDWTPRVTGLAA